MLTWFGSLIPGDVGAWVEAGLAQAEAEGGVAADIDEEIAVAIDEWTEIAGSWHDGDAGASYGGERRKE